MDERYRAPVQEHWHGRDDTLRYHQVIKCIDLRVANPKVESKIAIGFIGFACDEGIRRNQGRVGAAQGPWAIRQALSNFPILTPESVEFYDFGDIVCLDGDLEASQQSLAQTVAYVGKFGIFPFVFGGGHEVAWGQYCGIEQLHPNLECSIINIDAHLDVRPLLAEEKGSSGTSFLQIAELKKSQGLPFEYTCIGVQKTANTTSLIKKAEDLNAQLIYADDIYNSDASSLIAIDVLSKMKKGYLTICMDVFAAPFAPGVSAPQSLGLLPWQVMPIIQHLAGSGKLVGMNIAELSPPYDHDNITAKLAASIVTKFVQYYVIPKELEESSSQ